MQEEQTYTAFSGQEIVAFGPLKTVLPQVKAKFDENSGAQLLIFEDETGAQVDFNLQGTVEEVLARVLPPVTPPRPGRPKLGVVSREISLLPRHWSWLEKQPSGASAALRRLVDEARNHDIEKQKASLARDAASRFMSAMAGNLPDYEEALRAMYAGNKEDFEARIQGWPADIRSHVERMTRYAFVEETNTEAVSV